MAEGQRALRVAEEFADNSNGSIAVCYISWAYTAKGALGQAVEYGELAVQKAPTPADKNVDPGRFNTARCTLYIR